MNIWSKKLKTINPHSLLDEPKTVEITAEIKELYTVWKKLMGEKTDSGIGEFDAFIAGYFLGNNPMLREKYKDYKRFQDKIL